MHRWWKSAEVIQLVMDQFIPLAIDTRFTVDGRFIVAQGEIYDFLHGVGTEGNDRLVCATASGKLLAWAVNGGGEIAKGLEEWAQLPEEERMPGAYKVEPAVPAPIQVNKHNVPQGLPKFPTGGLALKSYQRALTRDETGNYQRDAFPFGDDRPVTEPQPDYFWLTKSEWQSLIPARFEQGYQFAVPDTITVRLAACHFHDFSKKAWHASEVQSGNLILKVDDVSSPAVVRMRLEGSTRMEGAARPVGGEQSPEGGRSGAEARWLGLLEYDRRKKAFTRVDLVAVGDCWDDAANSELGSKWMRPGHNPIGVAFELAGNTPAERIPPRALTPFSGEFGAYYAAHELNGK